MYVSMYVLMYVLMYVSMYVLMYVLLHPLNFGHKHQLNCLQLLSFVLLYFPVINTTLMLNQGRVYEWKVQQGEGQQENTIQYINCTFSIANRTYVHIAHLLQSRSLHYVREYCNECAMYTYVRFATENVCFNVRCKVC